MPVTLDRVKFGGHILGQGIDAALKTVKNVILRT